MEVLEACSIVILGSMLPSLYDSNLIPMHMSLVYGDIGVTIFMSSIYSRSPPFQIFDIATT